MFGIVTQPNSGAKICAKFIGLPVISLTEEVNSVYNQIYTSQQQQNKDVKIIPTRSEEPFSHLMITQEELSHIENAYKNGGTIRNIKLSIENIIRKKDPLYFVKQDIKDNITITDIKTSEEAEFLKQKWPGIKILQVIRLTEHAGIYNGYEVDGKYIDKKILNVSDIGTFEIKVRTVLDDMRA